MEQNILDEVRDIKKSLRLAMNGVVSTLQRRQGLDYKINFGVEIPRLKGIADAHAKSRELATALWQDNIRECKMLAIMLMPQEGFGEVAEEWIGSTRFTEIADHLAMHLLCRLPDAWDKALQWCARTEGMYRYCGYMTISHLVRCGIEPTPEQEAGLFCSTIAINSNNEHDLVARCALNALLNHLDRTPGAATRLKAAISNNATLPAGVEALLEGFE